MSELLEAAKHAVMEWRLHGQLTDSCRKLEAAIANTETAQVSDPAVPASPVPQWQNTQAFAAGWRAGLMATDKFGEQHDTLEEALADYLASPPAEPTP